MKSLELIVERIILSSRWILVAFYLGLALSLAVYAISFAYKFSKVAINVFTYDEGEMILAMPEMQEWIAAAKAEPADVEELEVEY